MYHDVSCHHLMCISGLGLCLGLCGGAGARGDCNTIARWSMSCPGPVGSDSYNGLTTEKRKKTLEDMVRRYGVKIWCEGL